MWLSSRGESGSSTAALMGKGSGVRVAADADPTLTDAQGNRHCPSPPLEGGESLCDFYIEHSTEPTINAKAFVGSLCGDESPEDGLPIVCNKVQDGLCLSPPNNRISSNNSFLYIFGQDFVPSNTFTQTFLQGILSSVDSRDPVVANAWMETLLDVIDLLPKDVIKRDILTLAINKGQLSQPVSSRLLCCKMLGKICTKFDPYVIRKEILPIVQSLCQDVDHEVRGCMCRQLDAVARGIGLEATKSAILPELVELANDEESSVRLSGIETIVRMLSLLDDETCTQIIIPLVKKVCENAIRTEDATLPVVARQLGRLCHGLSVSLTAEQHQWLLNFFRELAKLSVPEKQKQSCETSEIIGMSPMPDVVPEVECYDRHTECRHACAFNFPAMVLFCSPENFLVDLYPIFSELCSDPNYNIRRTMACGFHEIVKLLGPKASVIQKELVLLLKDESIEVLQGLIPHLPETLEFITTSLPSSNETKEEGVSELIQALIYCEQATFMTFNWRLHADFLTCLSCLPRCLSSELIYDYFVPLLFTRLHTARPIPCRISGAYSLLVLMESNPHPHQKQDMIKKLINEFCHGRSCHSRMLFIRVCQLALEVLSKSFFKEHFFRPLLSLAKDPVANIRLCLCSVLPSMKSIVQLPSDGSLFQELEACVRHLMTDEKDRDVSAAVQRAIEELDRIELTTEITINDVSRRMSLISIDKDEQFESSNETSGTFEKRCENHKPVRIVPKNPAVNKGRIPISKGASNKNSSAVLQESTRSNGSATAPAAVKKDPAALSSSSTSASSKCPSSPQIRNPRIRTKRNQDRSRRLSAPPSSMPSVIINNQAEHQKATSSPYKSPSASSRDNNKSGIPIGRTFSTPWLHALPPKSEVTNVAAEKPTKSVSLPSTPAMAHRTFIPARNFSSPHHSPQGAQRAPERSPSPHPFVHRVAEDAAFSGALGDNKGIPRHPAAMPPTPPAGRRIGTPMPSPESPRRAMVSPASRIPMPKATRPKTTNS